MSHIVLISPYDQGALGVRHLCAFLKREGHAVSLVFFKRYRNGLKATLKNLPDEELHEGLDLMGRDTILGISSAVTGEDRRVFGELIEELEPDLIGFSLRTITIGTAATLTADIKKRFESCGAGAAGNGGDHAPTAAAPPPVVWGGIGPTLEPERCLEHCDFVCRGEGEGALLELVNALASGGAWESVANIHGNAREGRPAFANPPRHQIPDLDTLPFADMSPESKFSIEEGRLLRDDPAISNYDWLYEISSTRGCPFDCSYCCNESIHRLYEGEKPVRRRGPEHVVEELAEALKDHRVERVNFQDDVFSMNRHWIERFTPLYKDKVGVAFWSYVHPKGLKRETLALLKEAGMRWATIGVQSGSKHILEDTYNRRHEPDAIIQVARWLLELGIDVNVDVITNNPLETPQDCRDTLEFLLDLPRGVRLNGGLSKLSVFPQTRMARLLKESAASPPPQGSEAFRETFNLLYLTSRQSWAPRGLLRAMGRSPFFLARPALIRPLLWPRRAKHTLSQAGRSLGTLPKRLIPASLWTKMKKWKKR